MVKLKVKGPTIQTHHIIYGSPEHPHQEYTVRVRKCEHLLLSRLDWYCRKQVSEGFIRAIKIWAAMNEHRATKL